MPLRNQQRVQTAIDYVTAHLAESLSVAEVAIKVHLSEFHFHRIFKQLTNEPFNQFVRRKRLEKAFHSLIRVNPPSMSEVSEACGFSSSANFSKAFRAYFGFSASDHRKGTKGINSKNGKLFSKYGKEIAPSLIYNGSLSESQINEVKQKIQRIEVVNVEESHYCCMASKQGYGLAGIQEAWSEMRHWLARHDIAMEAGKSVAFCWDNKWLAPEEVCRYECGYQLDDISWVHKAGIATRTRPAGRYLLIEVLGSSSDNEQFYLWLLSEYLPNAHVVPVHQYVFERYLEINCDLNIFHFEIMIKVN
jgi:AraC family transcriptional regulator